MRKNQKGFLIALCLCLLSLSGIFGVYQYRKGQDQGNIISRQNARVQETEETEKEAANSKGTIAQADTEDKETDQAKIETEEDIYKIGEAELAQTEQTPETEEITEEEKEQPDENDANDAVETAGDVQADRFSFAGDSSLLWPVDGNVILNYSMDKSIYFSTLNQYKYHPAIVISAEVGSEVQCAADGEVIQVAVNEETGTTVTMNLGNGYEAVYGQLKEVSVQEGDTVEAGHVIGFVSEPTKYYTLEGSNLYFQLLKDGEPVNPMNYIE